MKDQKLINAYSKTLKTIREQRQISQEKLAFDADLHPTYISMLERGLRQPSLSVIYKLADILGYSMSDFTKLLEQNINRAR